MSTVIKVDNISKQYNLGTIGTGTLGHDLNRWWARLRGKEDPFLKLGETNDRTTKGNSNLVWALRDVSFEVKQGDVLGIVGRNGAGKSTLLKVLSRTTSPTTGEFKVKGRIASLLEVGTGFHPELTGRENIFLNGAILGMRKQEIIRKFDEIVDFSGVERYIDTPVKRYSSGMYVRLAFAVAAHLEPEILIVDEVLAVGDMEFQRKCLGKMKDVSGQGRTVLFVSHNLAAVQNLCTTAMHMQQGRVIEHGQCDYIIGQYLDFQKTVNASLLERKEKLRITDIQLTDSNKAARTIYSMQEDLCINLDIENRNTHEERFDIILSVYNTKFELVSCLSTFFNGSSVVLEANSSTRASLKLPQVSLLEGTYQINVALVKGSLNNHTVLYKIENYDAFEIEGGNPYSNGIIPRVGSVLLESSWTNNAR